MTLHHTFKIEESVRVVNFWKQCGREVGSTTPLIGLRKGAGIGSREELLEIINIRGFIIAGMEGCEFLQVFIHVLLLKLLQQRRQAIIVRWLLWILYSGISLKDRS